MGHINQELLDQRNLHAQRARSKWLEDNSLPIMVAIQAVWSEHVDCVCHEGPEEELPSLWDYVQTVDDAMTLLARYRRELSELDVKLRREAIEAHPGELWIEDETAQTKDSTDV